jgi:hypothetical protein
VAGDYTLAIDAPADQSSPYAFQLHDLSQATLIEPGTNVESTLSPSRESELYRFEAQAGERFYFDAQRVTGAADIYWRLVNPYGKVVFDRTAFGDVGNPSLLTLELTGSYTLLIEGRIGATDFTTYRFNAQRVQDEVRALEFGQTQGAVERQWVAGPSAALNGALYLDGAMYAELAHNADTNQLRSATFEGWVKVDRLSDGSYTPILYKGNGGSGSTDFSYKLGVTSSGVVEFILSSTVGNNYAVSTGAGVVQVDEWHHVAAVVDHAGTAQIRLYVDGVLHSATNIHSGWDTRNFGQALQIGRSLEAGVGNLEGTLDELRVWNVARTQAQIQAAMSQELTTPQSGLVVYLKANEASGALLADATGRNNNGAIRNAYGSGGGVIAGRIDHPGQRDFYTFTLSGPKQVYFDSLT